jgi:hypothetical protein
MVLHHEDHIRRAIISAATGLSASTSVPADRIVNPGHFAKTFSSSGCAACLGADQEHVHRWIAKLIGIEIAQALQSQTIKVILPDVADLYTDTNGSSHRVEQRSFFYQTAPDGELTLTISISCG